MRISRAFALCLAALVVVGCSRTPASAPRVSISQVGEPVRVGDYEVDVSGIEQRGSVGSKFIHETAGDGELMIAAKYNVKNVSAQPVQAAAAPKLLLIDPLGGEYGADAGKSAAYAAEVVAEDKAAAQLAPNGASDAAAVFVVPKDRFDPDTWLLAIGGKAGPRVSLSGVRGSPAGATP